MTVHVPDTDIRLPAEHPTLHAALAGEAALAGLSDFRLTTAAPDGACDVVLGDGAAPGPRVNGGLELAAVPGLRDVWTPRPDEGLLAGIVASWQLFLGAPMHAALRLPSAHAPKIPWNAPVATARDLLLLGVGGLGGNMVRFLPWLGYRGRIQLVDHDDVSESNLNRCLLFGPAHIGHNKAKVAEAYLQGFGIRAEAFSSGFSAVADRGILRRPDVTVLAANEANVAEDLVVRFPRFAVTGAMNADWTAAASRHQSLVDDACTACPWPSQDPAPPMGCSVGAVRSATGASVMGSLPFLAPMNAAAMAGLSFEADSPKENRVVMETQTPWLGLRRVHLPQRRSCICAVLPHHVVEGRLQRAGESF